MESSQIDMELYLAIVREKKIGQLARTQNSELLGYIWQISR